MNSAPKASSSKTIASVERAADVLLVFASGDRQWWGITDIARTLQMPKAAVHRVLSSLRTRDIVTIDPETHRYALGPALVTLGLAALGNVEIRRRAQREVGAARRMAPISDTRGTKMPITPSIGLPL